MALKEPASFVDKTTWDFLNLLDMLGSRNGRVGVMEVDHAESRAPSLLVDFTRDLCGTEDIKHKPQLEENGGKEEEDLAPPHLIFMLWQASVLKRLMQWNHLEEAVRDVRNLLPCLPDVLVLVMIRPDSQEQLDQAVRALRRMQCVLDGALQLIVETAIYSPGQPGGVLEAKRAACRALREALNCHEGNWKSTPRSHLLFHSRSSDTAESCLNIGKTRYQRQMENELPWAAESVRSFVILRSSLSSKKD
nr:uncharacterized protein LOC115496371 isoform X1 [Taeniopygia guttata]XP_030136119.3 uncharacterized protein LOC115496371 isoform X1 [Taeniopygia guttata]XP_030136121.3 uncharacterized protein LOC115496371 isoform X1 [Taeniopygia guttata]